MTAKRAAGCNRLRAAASEQATRARAAQRPVPRELPADLDHDVAVPRPQRSASAGAGRRRQCAQPDRRRSALTASLAAFLLIRHARAALRRDDAAADPDARMVCGLGRLRQPSGPCRPPADPRGLTICNAVALLLLPLSREHFARLLAVWRRWSSWRCATPASLLLPHYVDPPVDRPGRARSWPATGAAPFGHKNGAGAAMVLLIFIGIFVARASNRTLGIAIVALAAFVPDLHAGEVAAAAAAAGAAAGRLARPAPAQPGAAGRCSSSARRLLST